ncbi:hypothetical protein, partial [Candidatus Thiosymbion oneisti]|uniref:hypothetical protein n=1 Tax=Candidatus Thiosymbion oneisti TaxID=589554 RepID=UPI001A9C349F
PPWGRGLGRGGIKGFISILSHFISCKINGLVFRQPLKVDFRPIEAKSRALLRQNVMVKPVLSSRPKGEIFGLAKASGT